MSTPQYTEVPARAKKIIETFIPPQDLIKEKSQNYASVEPRSEDKEGDTEVLDGVTFTHHFVEVPGDYETVLFHYVEAGSGEAIVFLHGIPDSWFQWHHQMAALAKGNRCVAFDLKGYGQSEKKGGDYRHEGVAEQMYKAFEKIGLAASKFNIVAHDRGTVQADYIVAKHPEKVLRYGRGEQHLYHFHPSLAPQGDLFMDPEMMQDPKHFVVWIYTWIAERPIPRNEFVRIIQEFSYPGTVRAVPRYFNSSTFRAEWLDRRNRLLEAIMSPVLVMEGYNSKTQPREFYENCREHIPNAKSVDVVYLPGGHFWSMESPAETTEAIRQLLAMRID
ncbi:alpha/beta hydrolase [Talaromyces proteolyticus]|uniref:Alpha/beta hydrolase n=1 Tax=Talaromyces proteolyticus TaxID=1131652 RepID=A0AAD4KT47_9EURO|nr:alpha/beta hydrolase [Talaromyces proteolyticus]KAH8698723.1 alpha/beta hydrolase [Talaromyces proteolyticus]